MQETQVKSLIQEDPTYSGATKCMCHNYWACALALELQLRSLYVLEPVFLNKRNHCNEKPAHCNREQPPLTKTIEKPAQQRRPSTVKNKYINKIILKVHSHASKSNILISLRQSRISVWFICNHIILRSDRYEREMQEKFHTWNDFADDSTFYSLFFFFFFKRDSYFIHFIQQIFIEHLLHNRLCFRDWDYSNGQNKVPALRSLHHSRIHCVGV